MKAELMILVFTSVLVVAGGISPAHAEADQTEKANVPFDFYVGGHRMPAGTYIIGIDLESEMITIANDSGARMFLMGVPTGNAGENSELVFKHLGNTYALAELKSDVTDLAFPTHVPASAIESRLQAPQVEVALNR